MAGESPRWSASLRRGGAPVTYAAIALAVSAVAFWVLRSGYNRKPACDRPRNVILITIDTLRADHVSGGGGHDTTPNIARFFAAGTRFSNASSGAPCTSPSVVQILTGAFRSDEAPRLAETLAAQGYATAAIVSQQVFGWAERSKPEYSRGFEHFDIQSIRDVTRHGMTGRTAAEVTDAALQWLASRDPAKPFLLWLHFYDPHDPYKPPEEFGSPAGAAAPPRVADGDRRSLLMLARRQAAAAGRPPSRPGYGHVRANRWRLDGHIFSPQEVRRLTELYDGEILYTDRELGRLFTFLERQSLVDDSIVVLTADHGERLGEDDTWDHCLSLHRTEVAVPLMVLDAAGPLGEDRRVDLPVSTLDIVPTILARSCASGGADRRGWHGGDGIDLAAARSDRRVFSVWGNTVAVRTRDWKLVLRGDDVALYDLERDPGETRDVGAEHPTVTAELAAAAVAFALGQGDLTGRFERIIGDLRALGYMD